jgi:MraZ protein
MFQGAVALNLDAKGRLAVPTRFRAEIDEVCKGAVIVTVHPHRCLLIYPEPVWGPIRDEVLARSSLDEAAAKVRRLFVGNANPEQLDSAGPGGAGRPFRTVVGRAGGQQQQEEIFALGADLMPRDWETLPL